MVYIVQGVKESLLGLAGGEALGIILIMTKGCWKQESVGEIHETVKKTVKEG